MLSSLANYLLRSSISSAQDSRENALEAFPVMARLRQVDVEGDDWILIDRNVSSFDTGDYTTVSVEGATSLEESWYVMPPACFTRSGPVNVETSPLEDLLIEHPSMSVYRVTSSSATLDTPPPTPNIPDEDELEDQTTSTSSPMLMSMLRTASSLERSLERSLELRNNNNRGERRPKPAIHDGRPAAIRLGTDKVRILQLRSAQKVLEKRSTQALKRGRLERNNKLREVFSVKGKRPRRQDRLRIQNSGANNNRKC